MEHREIYFEKIELRVPSATAWDTILREPLVSLTEMSREKHTDAKPLHLIADPVVVVH